MLNPQYKRQGQMEAGYIYFYTQSIHGMKPLLKDDHLKMEVIKSLQYLTGNQMIRLYGYVIMLNHIHLLWEILKIGKESPAAAFSKFTAHQFQKYLKNAGLLDLYYSEAMDRDFRFCKRDPLAIELSSAKIFFQRLEYAHYNPVKAGLCKVPEEYRWSSARFYMDGYDEFNMLTRFNG